MHAEVSGLIMCLSLKYSDRVYSNPQISQVSADYMLKVIAIIIFTSCILKSLFIKGSK